MINFITVDNGVGLSRDMKILSDTLGISYNFVDYITNKGLQPADVNVFFEVTRENLLSSARYNVIIPNPEWFQSNWLSFIDRFDLVLCKTRHTQEVFSQYVGDRAVYVGWTSDNRYNKTMKIRKYLHTQGKSETKNTQSVFQAFTQYKHMVDNSQSLLLTSVKQYSWLKSNAYVIVNNTRLSDRNIKKVQNTFQFHICPSSYEGYGHYINEALSCGAIVITTDAAPMNELCKPEYSILCPATIGNKMGIVDTYYVSPKAIHEAIEQCNALTEAQTRKMSRLARTAYLQSKDEFERNIRAVWQWK